MEHWIRMPDALKEQVFAHLSRLAAVANLSPENRLAYDRAVDRYNVNRLAEETFLQEVEEAKEKAIAEAKANGMKEGLEKGLKKGRLSEKYAIAKNLKESGVSKSLIAQSTGLPEEKIEGL